MSDHITPVYEAIDRANADKSAATRRQLVAGAAAAIGSMGLLTLPERVLAGGSGSGNTPENILAIAATAEVLATIVNTVGPEKIDDLEGVTLRNIQAAAREELIHFDVLTSAGVGGKELTRKIWVPDAVFEDETSLLRTLEVGDQIFINAYLIGTTAFGNAGNGTLARIAAEFMAVEAVHRALARQSLGKLGNDRVFAKYEFTSIGKAVELLQGAGFGFGVKGKGAGAFYQFDSVRKRTPNPSAVNTRSPK